MSKGLIVLVILAVVLPSIIGNASAWGWTLISADSGGSSKDDFKAGDTVFARAKTVSSSNVNLYVTSNYNWQGGESLSDVSGGFETVIADSAGYIPVTPIWTPGSGDVGDYDIVLDENQNGILDSNDLVDSVFEVGFSVEIPEFATIAIPVGAILGLFLFFNYRKRGKE